MEQIKNYLGCGRVEKRLAKGCDFTVTTSFETLFEKLDLNKLLGLKLLDYKDFYQAYLIRKNKQHLTEEGLNCKAPAQRTSAAGPRPQKIQNNISFAPCLHREQAAGVSERRAN